MRIALLFTTLISGTGPPGIAKPSSNGVAEVTPGALITAAATASNLSTFTTICVGSPSPPGKCVSNNFCPTTDSGLVVKVSTVPMPSALSVVEVNANANKITPVTTHAFRGLRPIVFPSFDHTPPRTWSTPSNSGRRGQKIQRPKRRSSAGKSVKIVMTEHAIPIAPIGPRPAVLVNWLNKSTRREIATVEPDARIGSQTPLYAARIASNLFSCK